MSQISQTTLTPPDMTSVSSVTPHDETSSSSASSVSGSLSPNAPAAPPLQDLQQAGSRIREMARSAVGRAGGLPCLDDRDLAAIIANEPRPGIFSRGRSEYKAMEKAAADCDAANRELSAISVQEFARSPISDKAFNALQNYVKAQNAFSSCIDAYVSARGKDIPALASLRQSAQFRAAEALNFAACMQNDRPAVLPGSVREGIMQKAPDMHGGSFLLDSLRGQAMGLFDRIDALQGKHALAKDEFDREIDALSNEVNGLKGKLAAKRSEVGFQADEAVFGALEGMLTRSSERLSALKLAKPRSEVATALKVVMGPVEDADLEEVSKLITHGKDLKDAVREYNEKARDLAAQVKLDMITPARLRQEVTAARDKLQQSQGMQEAYALMVALARQDLSLPPALERLTGKFFASDAEADELGEMMDAARQNRHARAEYIAMAYDHNLDLQTVMEASLRGIPPDQLELEAGDAVLKESHNVGQGAVNSVDLCTYRGSDGESKVLVFKPELGARRGLNLLCAGHLGYDPRVRAMQLNVAAYRSAAAIGCGDVIARSSIGSHNGEIGLFMEAAPGMTPHAMGEKGYLCETADGRKLDHIEAIDYMTKKGTLRDVRANLMRECNKLEWADLLSGQVDRHWKNYLVHINPETGAVKVTGIDNDASFGFRRVGLNKVDVSGLNPLAFSGVTRDTANPNLVDLAALSADEVATMQRIFGFNQASLPTCIDTETLRQLRDIDVDEYRRAMRSCMGEDAADAAVSRLVAAKAYAETLPEVTDWTSQDAKSWVWRGRDTECPIRNGFYNRDFAPFFGY